MKLEKYLIVALLLALLTGCASSGAGTAVEESVQEQTVQEETQEDVSEEMAEDQPAEVQQMTAMFLGTTQDEAVLDIIQKVTDEFNANNPYNAEFSYESYGNEEYKTKLATVMAANDAPDVFFTWSAGFLKPYVEGGRVYEVGQLLNADDEWMSRFNEGVFGPVSYDGKIYAVPHGQTVAVMYYNTSLFEEYGVAVPTTHEELLAAVDTFNENGIVPISLPAQDAWVAGQFLQQLANGVGGIDLFNGTVDGTVAWNDPAYVEAGTLFLDLAERGAFPDGFLGMTYDEGRQIFGQEEAAMFYMGSWEINALSDPELPVSEHIGVFNIPPSADGTGNVALGDVDQALAIGANTVNPEAAAAYIKMFSDAAAQEAYAYDANYLISTTTPLDETQLSPLFLEVLNLQQDFTGVTPWLDRVFGAGEGVEFNNAAVAIAAGTDPAEQMDILQQFAEDNAER